MSTSIKQEEEETNDNGPIITTIVIAPDEIIALAKTRGYSERRESVSATLFFIEDNPAFDMPPVRINIYYTTRSIMTHLNHPKMASSNELWRSNAYTDLASLEVFFQNPRIHTSKGYRFTANNNAIRGCVQCGIFKKRSQFSYNQWTKKGPTLNKCQECVMMVHQQERLNSNLPVPDPVTSSSSSSSNSNVNIIDDTVQPATLTADALKSHNEQYANGNTNNGGNNTKTIHNRLVRRQFNCPDCPKHGRGPFVFYKKVPAMKPIVKCPQCKKLTTNQGGKKKCQQRRLYPVPVAKGYGLYKCHTCHDKWGSSRAVSNIGQECWTCKTKHGNSGIFVKPFRMEVFDRRKTKKSSSGNKKKNIRPKEPIKEEEVEEREYTKTDRERNAIGGNAALIRNNRQTSSFQYSDDDDDDSGNDFDSGVSSLTGDDNDDDSGVSVSEPKPVHYCQGCASGICSNRKLPKSKIHDVSDGNTVSTRSSIMTNSSIDKTDFIDRDMEFAGFDFSGGGNDDDDDGGDSFDILTDNDNDDGSWHKVSY